MKARYEELISLIKTRKGEDKDDAIFRVNDILRSPKNTEDCSLLFTELLKQLRVEKNKNAIDYISDALFDGMVNDHDEGSDMSLLLGYLHSTNLRQVFIALYIFSGKKDNTYMKYVTPLRNSEDRKISEYVEKVFFGKQY